MVAVLVALVWGAICAAGPAILVRAGRGADRFLGGSRHAYFYHSCLEVEESPVRQGSREALAQHSEHVASKSKAESAAVESA